MTTTGNVNSTSMLDFKAEFLKKKQEFQSKLQSNDSQSRCEIRPTPLDDKFKCDNSSSKKLKNKTHSVNKSEKDAVADAEIDNRLELSRKKLLEKSRLYESMRREFPKTKEDEECLVDFERKFQDSYDSDDDIDSSNHLADNKWVEYTDSLGRVRKCHPDDLEEYARRDRDMQRDNNDSASDESAELSSTFFPPGEVKRMHYEDLRENEIRSHGVGYYSFSVDETEREKQQAELLELHRQTERNRMKKEEVKTKRKALLDKRLERVRLNRGLPPAPPKPVNSNEDEDNPQSELSAPDALQLPVVEPPAANISNLKRPTALKRPHVREWDRGKSFKLMSQDDYADKEREKRISEFAPPSFYK